MDTKKTKLTIAGIIFIIILLLWPVLALFSLPGGSTHTAQLESIKNDSTLYIINFIVAFLVAPSLLFMLFEFYKEISGNTWTKISKSIVLLYTVYFVLVSISYGSQFIYLPFILESSENDKILKWYFYNDRSWAMVFNQTGYLFWSIATILIFTKYVFKSKVQFLAIKDIDTFCINSNYSNLRLLF